jgi:hypothetical protein
MGFSLKATGSSKILSSVNKTVDGIMAASAGLLCLKDIIFGFAANPGALLQQIAGVAAGLMASITASITGVITARVNQIIGSVLSPIAKITGIINDLTSILVEIQGLTEKSLNLNLYFQSKQSCASFAAQFMNCLVQSAMDKVTNKITMEVDKHVGKIADQVSKEAFKVNGTIDNFVNRNNKFLEKANMQTKFLT